MSIVLTLSLLTILHLLNWSWKHSTSAAREQMVQFKHLQGRIVYLDEVLTMSAMMAATTGDVSWEDRYRTFEPQLDQAIKQAVQKTAEQSIFSAAQTDEANGKLVAMENEAFAHVRAGRNAEAQAILFGTEYAKQKKIYADGITSLDRALNELTKTASTDLVCADHWHEAIMASIIVFVALSWTVVFRAMRNSELVLIDSHNQLSQQAEELVRANLGLENSNKRLCEEISSRELAEAKQNELHQELTGKTRQAAMAELATGVLHNVGNALNSVNVATNFAVDQVAKSHMADLSRATELMQEHKGNLADFFTSHERGKLVLPYLEQLAGTLRSEKDALLECLRELDHKVEHVKQIVRAQQTQAKVSGVISEFELHEVLESELGSVQDSMKKHGIALVRDYQYVPTVNSDKHKVMQILGNLVRNSVRALIDADQPAKQLAVHISSTPDNGAVIEVEDNGVGIDEATLQKIFQYGFTTKKDGHGFGLHHSMLAARELGGEILVHSDGLGHGARFTLIVPIEPATSAGKLAAAATA